MPEQLQLGAGQGALGSAVVQQFFFFYTYTLYQLFCAKCDTICLWQSHCAPLGARLTLQLAQSPSLSANAFVCVCFETHFSSLLVDTWTKPEVSSAAVKDGQ